MSLHNKNEIFTKKRVAKAAAVGGVAFGLWLGAETIVNAQEPITPESQPNNGQAHGPVAHIERTDVYSALQTLSINWDTPANLPSTGVTDGTGAEVVREELSVHGNNSLQLDPYLSQLSRDGQLIVLAQELGVKQVETDPAIPLYNQHLTATAREPVILPVNCDEQACVIETGSLPAKSDWLLLLRTMSDLETREMATHSFFIHKVGPTLKGPTRKNVDEQSVDSNTPDLDAPEGNGPFIPQPQTGIRTGSNSPYSTFGGLKRSRGIV